MLAVRYFVKVGYTKCSLGGILCREYDVTLHCTVFPFPRLIMRI